MHCNVQTFKGLGWVYVITRGVAKGWSYRYKLTLECGHTVEFVTPPTPSRGYESPPGWIDCKQCDEVR